MENVYEKIVGRINQNIDDGKTEQAKLLISSLERLNPNHGSIAHLQKRLATARRAQAQEAAKKQKVTRLYERADIYLSSGRARSADKIYTQITRLSPNDSGLKPLGKKIADAYVGLAQREIDARDWRDVGVWVEKGLKHVPNHQKLIEMRTYAEQQMANRP